MEVLSRELFNKLKKISIIIRKRIVENSANAKIPHLGSCLSCVDLLVYLYWIEMKIDPLKPQDLNRDRFILSKGHGAPALFQVLAEKSFFPKKYLDSFGKNNSLFHEHPPKPGLINGVEAATGSLGHGFPMALGMALSSKIQNKTFKTYALLSDGECNEGSIWEAALLAPKININSLIGIIDYNKWQATGRSDEITSFEPLLEKWKAFGWHSLEVNGHDFFQIHDAFQNCHEQKNKPCMIIAHTIKGKGVSFMEDDNNWHYKIPNNDELQSALEELDSSFN